MILSQYLVRLQRQARNMAKNTENKEKTRLLRIPVKIDKAVQERAKKNQRSINGQIVFELDHRTTTV